MSGERITAERYHDISAGHRVVGHESKCRHLHGHNYRIHFVCQALADTDPLDGLGRVVDFGVIKERLCMWVESNWDHKFLAWEKDTLLLAMQLSCGPGANHEEVKMCDDSIVYVPFNPTAENMAKYLVEVVGPQQLSGLWVELVTVRIEETAKCSCTYTKGIQ